MNTPEQADLARRRKNRLQLIAILAIVLIPVLGSTFMYYTGIGMPKGTNNKGQLIDPPITVSDIELRNQGNQYESWANSGNFRLALFVDGPCDELCGELLHNMRQVHVRLAKRSTSLERWFVQLDTNMDTTLLPGTEQSMAAEYPRMQLLRGDLATWRQRLQQNGVIDTEFKGHQLLLIDRRGNLIMAFNREQSGQDMLDDVLFLIKSTQ